ncbi:uncharacterized protein LOC142579793 isoform X2 [Dermacentor variabilis]|uniref:uncharacterized protein LOC142579793 isoform X2 n=1 Tax=Dermacentor variabilis TaxID=34621 RepID=UPI003F5C6918
MQKSTTTNHKRRLGDEASTGHGVEPSHIRHRPTVRHFDSSDSGLYARFYRHSDFNKAFHHHYNNKMKRNVLVKKFISMAFLSTIKEVLLASVNLEDQARSYFDKLNESEHGAILQWGLDSGNKIWINGEQKHARS